MIQAWSRRPTGFLYCFDTVGLVIRPVTIVPEMTYYVSSGTLDPIHSLTRTYSPDVVMLPSFFTGRTPARNEWLFKKCMGNLREGMWPKGLMSGGNMSREMAVSCAWLSHCYHSACWQATRVLYTYDEIKRRGIEWFIASPLAYTIHIMHYCYAATATIANNISPQPNNSPRKCMTFGHQMAVMQ